MKNIVSLIILGITTFLFASGANAEIYTNPDEVKFQPDPEVIEEIETESGVIENENIADNDTINLFFVHSPSSLGTIYTPRQVDTEITRHPNDSSVSVEFTIIDGKFVMYEQQGYYYYVENATQSWFNAATGSLASAGSSLLKARLTYGVVGKLPYLKNIYSTKTGELVKQNINFVSATSAMVTYQMPIIGPIVYQAVPLVGTKDIIVYVSKTGADNTWHYRFRFVVAPDGSYTITKWYVK